MTSYCLAFSNVCILIPEIVFILCLPINLGNVQNMTNFLQGIARALFATHGQI